jgi:hypothetical protein
MCLLAVYLLSAIMQYSEQLVPWSCCHIHDVENVHDVPRAGAIVHRTTGMRTKSVSLLGLSCMANRCRWLVMTLVPVSGKMQVEV